MKIRFETIGKCEVTEVHTVDVPLNELHDRTLDQYLVEAFSNGLTFVEDKTVGVVTDRELEPDSIEEASG